MALRVGVVGAGQVSRVHFEALRGTDAVQVVGVFDQNQERARERASENGVDRVYSSLDDLLGDDAVECVAVLLPHDLHERFAVAALEAGKHVVCEKPLGQSVAECGRMLEAARRAGRRLFPVHNRVHSPAVERMAEIVRAGQIGEVILAQTTGFEGPNTVGVRPWLATESGGGGVLMAQAVHPAYALRWMLGDVARVGCMFGDRKVVPMTAEDTAIATLKFRSGVVAEMTATFGIAHGPFDHAIFLHGRDGYLELSRRALRAISPQIFGDAELHEVHISEPDSAAVGFRRMWQDYARAIGDGGEARQTGEDGLRAVEIVEAAYRSNASGCAVELPL